MRKFLLLLISISSLSFAAEAPPPNKDLDNAGDHPLVGRFEGSFVVTRDQLAYDEIALPVSVLKPVPGQTDSMNNLSQTAEKFVNAAGKRQRIIYVLPQGRTLIEFLANYKNTLTANNVNLVYECSKQTCGGGDKLLMGGGGKQSIGMLLWNAEKVKGLPAFGAAFCAQNGTFSDSRYAVFATPDKTYVSLQLYDISRGFCSSWSGRQIAIVDVIEPAAMQQKMQVVDAQQMAKSIKSQGRVALYGIYFDSGSANIKSESADELSQIAQLLGQQSTLKLLVVGHTDDAGNYADNISLSKRRAEAVVAELTSKYKIAANRLQPVGVSFASPVASNDSEGGKAKNRRVELVPFK